MMNKDILVVIEHLRGEVADISYVMLAAARLLAQGSGGEVIAILLGSDVQALANDLSADKVLSADHPALTEFEADVYNQVLTAVINESQPRAVLIGHTSTGMDIASVLSARLGLPLVSSCQRVRADEGALKYVSQICGGKIMAEGILPEPTCLVTMVPGGYKPEEGQSDKSPEVSSITVPPLDEARISLVQYIEPDAEDVDISKESILIAVGRGLQNEDDLELMEELAEALGGTVCASRPIVDQGWLPTTRLVGKSGKAVKPTLYLALGISGAPEHVESITGSEMIIAINTDPDAPIFDMAQYGADVDMLDLTETLIEQIQ
jgi:electron transfer flavoprotein alpha subunit